MYGRSRAGYDRAVRNLAFTPARSRWVIASLGGLVTLAYLATLPSPLRVDTDSAYMLELGGSFADGHGLDIVGVPSFPPGYPFLVGVLEKLGIATPAVLILVGLTCLAIGVACWWIVCLTDLALTRVETGAVLVVTALSVYAVKYTAMPLTEIPFLALTAGSLALLALARQRASIALLVAGVLVAGLACTVRSAGITLALAVVLAPASRRLRVVVGAVAAAGALVVAVTAPYALGIERWLHHPGSTASSELRLFVRALGAAAANVPISEMHKANVVIVVVGLLTIALVAWAVWSRRGDLRPVDGFVVATLAMVLVYPTEHPRFYLPAIPALAAYVVLATRRVRWLGVLAAGAFGMVGCAALAFSVHLSYAGRGFPTDYADGVLAPTYRTAWGVAQPGDADRLKLHELAALRRYDPTPPWTRSTR